MIEERKYIRDGRAPIPENESTSRIMSSIKDRDTKPELALRKELWKKGIKGYRIHWKRVPGKPDIAFPIRKLAIFVNGCFWHRCPYCNPPMPKTNNEFWTTKFERNIERDKSKILHLKASDWESIIVWECQIKENVKDCVERINKVLIKL